MRGRVTFAVALALSVVATGIPAGAEAQVPDTAAARRLVEQRLGRSVSQQEIVRQIQGAGLSRSQVRRQLQSMGLDPGLADYYFDLAERGMGAADRAAAPEMVAALQSMGVALEVPYGDPFAGSRTLFSDTAVADSAAKEEDTGESAEPSPVFGLDFFRRREPGLQRAVMGPVDRDYRLGPGDQIGVILSGGVELAYAMDVAREGYIVLPDVGQIQVNGLTLAELEDRLYQRLGDVYAGVGRGPGATTRVQVALGRVRTILVYVMGEVVEPGAFQVGGLSTVFDALYDAGGPTERGSFRTIQVRRVGRTVATLDLYRYLLSGDGRADIRLEQGDVIFVPVTGPRVRIEGAVQRPAIFEVVGGEGLRDVIRFAGGLSADAVVRRAQIDRVLPPEDRGPGRDRVLLDVDVTGRVDGGAERIPLRDGDRVTVFRVSDLRRNRVSVSGAVRRPGTYEWVDGMTLWDLVSRADGLDEAAYTARAHVLRLNEDDGTRRLLPVALVTDSGGRPVQDVPLADRDSVVVLSRAKLRNREFVHIAGLVKEPGTYPLAGEMTIRDLILAAGGFTHGAVRHAADVARMPEGATRSDTTARVFRVSLGEPVKGPDDAEIPRWLPQTGEFVLRHGDQVYVRRAPGYEPLRSIVITGEVMEPGRRVLEHRDTRLTDVVARAGGLTREGHAAGARLYRRGDLVAVNLAEALDDPASRFNFLLEDGDSLHVPKYDPTVLVTGAVAFETRVPYVEGEGLEYYIAQAGGYGDLANRGAVSVTYQNGQRAIVRELLVFRRKPEPGPGSMITVPQVPAEQRRAFDVVGFVTTVLPSVTTLLLALAQLR